MFGRKKKDQNEKPGDSSRNNQSMETDRTLTAEDGQLSKAQIKRATRTRLCFALFTSFLLLITVVFMILTEVGNTSTNSIRSSIYFIRLNLSNIGTGTTTSTSIQNSIAQTLGLHDYYQVGLWNFCEGNQGEGITSCSTPQTLYWFNPVQIILNELLSGSTITLPAEVTNILTLIRIVSHWMFGLFLSGACLAFVMIFINPLSVFSRWAALVIALLNFLVALFITVAAVIATVMFIIMRNAFTSVDGLNVGATIGVKMFVFMWIAAGCSIIAFVIQMGECCCCASRRDVRTGRKRGSKKAYNTETVGVNEKPARRGIFGRKK